MKATVISAAIPSFQSLSSLRYVCIPAKEKRKKKNKNGV